MLGRRVELHSPVRVLNADDDDVQLIAGNGRRQRAVPASGESFSMRISSSDSSRLSELVAISTKSTTAGRSAVCAICTRADAIRRNDAIGARLLELLVRILSLGARNDEQVGLHDARRQHRVDILRVGADRRHQAAGALDAQALQGLLAARVAFNGEMSLRRRRPARARACGRR